MNTPQPGILLPVPPFARFLTFALKHGAAPRASLHALADAADGEHWVAGLGPSVVLALGGEVEGLRPFPNLTGPGFDIPATDGGLWVWVRGDDRGEVYHQTRRVERILADAFALDQAVDAFRYLDGRDLTGYEDGTENPKGEDAETAAIVQSRIAGLDGSSFVAVQQWLHQLDRFETLSPEEQDNTFGRHRVSNDEIEDAPPSAHVKRTAQESFEPAAFVVRRSMPWTDGRRAGLVFVAFGASLGAFEAQLRRMAGLEDGVTDALFGFTRPVTGAYYWCPGMREGRLDLSILGL